MLCPTARLSLPTSDLAAVNTHTPAGTLRVGVSLLGHILELAVLPIAGPDVSTRWAAADAD